MTDITYRYGRFGLEVTFEGRTSTTYFGSNDPASMRAYADDEERRANEALYRARRARALADLLEHDRAVAAERRRKGRNAKAAATRARNARSNLLV